MIISYSRNFIFVHLHKNAGTAIERTLAPHLGNEDLLLGSTGRGAELAKAYRGTELHPHATANEICAWLGVDRYAAMFRFTVVRHPVTLAYSLFSYSLNRLRILSRRLSRDLFDPTLWENGVSATYAPFDQRFPRPC